MKKSLLLTVLLALLCLVVVTGCGRRFARIGGRKSAIENAVRKEEVKGNVVGNYLRNNFGNSNVVVVCSAGTSKSTLGKTFLKALEKNFNRYLGVVELKEDNWTGEGASLKELEEALKEHEGVQLIIFYGGTAPANFEKLNTNAVFFFFEQGSCTNEQIRKGIKSGKVIGLLIGSPNAPRANDPVENDDREAFHRRYIIVDRDNLWNIKD